MDENKNMNNDGNDKIVEVINTVIKFHGVKVDRKGFLMTQFKDVDSAERDRIIELGPVSAGVDRDTLKKKATDLLNPSTFILKDEMFHPGIPMPFKFATPAAIPANMLQLFYAVVIRTAQEIAYLYGEPDIWKVGGVEDERVRGQLILYCGAMFGARGAVQAVRVLSAQSAKSVLKKLSQKELLRIVYCPNVNSVCEYHDDYMTGEFFAQDAIYYSLLYASMVPMGMRLINVLDDAQFAYTAKDFEEDWREIVVECGADGEDVPDEIKNVAMGSDGPEKPQAENVQ